MTDTALCTHLLQFPECAPAAASPATGRPGDFDFLSGEWRVKHRRLVAGEWDSFDGEATVVPMLGGVASVEELRIPARNFAGMGVRLFDAGRKAWADYWVNKTSGVLNSPCWGGFANGVGVWDTHEADSEGELIVRGVWDEIGPDTCRWRQATSRDGGKSWDENWVMRWQRVGAVCESGNSPA